MRKDYVDVKSSLACVYSSNGQYKESLQLHMEALEERKR